MSPRGGKGQGPDAAQMSGELACTPREGRNHACVSTGAQAPAREPSCLGPSARKLLIAHNLKI